MSSAMVMGEEAARQQEPMAAVLVYGTLRQGFANHHWLGGSRPLGAGVMQGLALYDLGPFPMAVPSVDAALLHGELYGVSAAVLGRLDRLEGVPRLYERWLRPLLGGGEAWVYVGRPAQVRHSPRLVDGRWPGPRPGRRCP
jgi:gamma-glutamylcyclotransferase (GGCT)/AIG2-like uncharacterized protein YtfP